MTYIYLFVTFCIFLRSYIAENVETSTEDPNYLNLDEIDEENITVNSLDVQDMAENEKPKQFVDDSELEWMKKMIQDVGHFLRRYKFTEYDRRYLKKAPKIPGQYVGAFPFPPLRSLHWEVSKKCEESFSKCLKYLNSKIEETVFRKEDDTVYLMHEMEWTYEKNYGEIIPVDDHCRYLLKESREDATPFAGPLERFQWSTTASYFMCWYTMNEHPALQHFNEPCDNFATCLNRATNLASNQDPRAVDSDPFACAQYSFCPDPCCPIRRLKSWDECYQSEKNPCLEENPGNSSTKACLFEKTKNTLFLDIVRNRFNVTCHCQNSGFIWTSKYGFCVDIDECVSNQTLCQAETEICINTKGSYKCTCKWGHIRNTSSGICEPSPALIYLKKEKEKVLEELEEGEKTKINLSFFHFVKQLVVGLFSNAGKNGPKSFLVLALSFVHFH